MTDHLVAVRSRDEVLTDRDNPGGPPFTAVVADGAHLPAGFLPAIEGVLREAGGDTCVYGDFRVAGQRIAVGEWSVERSRWQHWTGPVMVVPTHMLCEVADPLIDPPRLSGDVRYLPKVLSEIDADDLRDLTTAERSRFTAHLPFTIGGTATRPRRESGLQPSRSIVIPTRGSGGRLAGREVRWLDECLSSLGTVLDDPGVDVVLVLDDDVDPGFTAPWRERLGGRLGILATPGPFNFPTKVNAGVAQSRGEIVALLNDDVVALTPDWLDRMAVVATEPEVGAVGAVLVYEDGAVQHRGHVFAGGEVHLLDRGGDTGDAGPRGRNLCDRDVSGVTGACLVQRREVWDRMGGFDPALPVAFNDVDYTERLRSAGLRVVLCNSVRLHHFESKTRPGHATPDEWELIHTRWASSFGRPDPFTPLAEPPPARGRVGLRQRMRTWWTSGPHRP